MSKLGKLGRFLSNVGHFAPLILAVTPLAPIAGPVAAAIAEAEQIAGATGPEKLQHVVNVAEKAAAVAQAAGAPIDPDAVKVAAGDVVSAIVSVANVAHQKQAA